MRVRKGEIEVLADLLLREYQERPSRELAGLLHETMVAAHGRGLHELADRVMAGLGRGMVRSVNTS